MKKEEIIANVLKEWLDYNRDFFIEAVKKGVIQGIEDAIPYRSEILGAISDGVEASFPNWDTIRLAILDGTENGISKNRTH